MRPFLLRPPDFVIGARSDFSGRSVVISSKSEVVMNQAAFREGARRLAVVSGPPRYEADWRRLGAYALLGYRTRILEKMHMQNNAELIHYAVQTGLVD